MENKKASSRKSRLPLYGVGPVYGAVIIAVTAAAVIAGHSTLFEKGIIKGVKIPSAMIGILLIIWNLFFYPLFFFYWILMTVLMKCTEEKWLKNLYGREYEEYCRRVNRCIPWLPKSGKGTCI